ncbi:hypothetical protein QEG73_20205 [Chitinophagaceae bacterium 26-R-25]|nr:hypothetical protein [Chitinophagaceae bacterium 26-R-25]
MKYLAFAIVILSISCKKQSEVVKYPQRLYLTQISSKQNVRLFTNNSEIKSSSVINSFVGDNSNFQIIAANQFTPNTDYIDFLSSDTAMFSTSDYVKYDVTKSGNQFILKSQIGFPYSDNVMRSIVRSIMKYPGQEVKGPPGMPTSGFEYGTSIGYGNYSNFELCWLAYKIVKHPTNGNYLATGMLQNEFNPNVISTLGANDTLAIQECRLLFK